MFHKIIVFITNNPFAVFLKFLCLFHTLFLRYFLKMVQIYHKAHLLFSQFSKEILIQMLPTYKTKPNENAHTPLKACVRDYVRVCNVYHKRERGWRQTAGFRQLRDTLFTAS